MADQPSGQAATAPTEPNVPATGAVTEPQQAQTPLTTQPTETVDSLKAQVARLESAVKDANRESASRRKRLDELEAAEAKRAQESLSETDRLKAQLADAQRSAALAQEESARTVVRSVVVAQAAAMNFADPNDAYGLIDLANISINEDGKVVGVEDALKKLAEAKPYLKRATAPRLPPTSPGAGASGGETDEQRRARLYGGSSGGIFDPVAAQQMGGGVVWNPETRPKQQTTQ